MFRGRCDVFRDDRLSPRNHGWIASAKADETKLGLLLQRFTAARIQLGAASKKMSLHEHIRPPGDFNLGWLDHNRALKVRSILCSAGLSTTKVLDRA